MKTVKLQIEIEIPNKYQLNDNDDIVNLLCNFPHNVIFIDGKII
jgi:hypothetical protein